MKRRDPRSVAATAILVASVLFLASGAVAKFLRMGPEDAASSGSAASRDSAAARSAAAERASALASAGRESRERAEGLRAERTLDEHASATGAATRDELLIEGRVVDEGGAPLPGALVALDLRPGDRPAEASGIVRPHVSTDGDGRFAFAGAGDLASRPTAVLLARAAGHAPLVVSVRLERRDVDLGDLQLGEGGGVFGQVIDEAGGAIAGATVSLQPTGAGPNLLGGWGEPSDVAVTTTTDASGSYEASHLVPGSWRVVAKAPGFQEARLRDAALVDEKREIELVPLRLLRGFALAGRVVDPADEPVAGASVRARSAGSGGRFDAEVASDATGRFALDHLPPGRLRVEATAAGFSRSARVEVDATEAREVTLQLEPGLRVSGIVVDAASGAPVERFAARLRPDGDERADALQERLRRRIASLREERGRREDDAVARERVALELERRLSAPAPGASPPARPPGDVGPLLERPGGRFEFGGLEAGTYALDVAPESHGFATLAPIEVRAGAPTDELRIVVHAGVSVSGEVVRRADRTPLAAALVELVWLGAEEDAAASDSSDASASPFAFAFAQPGPRGTRVAVARSDAAGGFTIENAPPGRCLLVASHDDAVAIRGEPFELKGARGGVRLELGSLAALHGRVRDLPAGRERQVRVLALGGFGTVRSVEVEPSGAFRVERLPPGPYVVRALLPAAGGSVDREIASLFRDEANPVAPDVTLAEGEVQEIELELGLPAVGAVEGAVTVNGESRPGLQIVLRATSSPRGGSGSFRTVPDRLGQFAIRDVPPGDYLLQLTSTSGRQELHRRALLVGAGATTWVQAVLAVGGVRGSIELGEKAQPEDFEGTLSLLPGATAAPADLREYGRTNLMHTIRIRRGVFEADPVTAGPALALLELRGRQLVETRIEVPVAATLELTLKPGRRR